MRCGKTEEERLVWTTIVVGVINSLAHQYMPMPMLYILHISRGYHLNLPKSIVFAPMTPYQQPLHQGSLPNTFLVCGPRRMCGFYFCNNCNKCQPIYPHISLPQGG
jgi:hypothetical protein